jgi:hypothetical protein
MRIPACAPSSSSVRCAALPVPGVATVTCPGRARSSARNSVMLRAGRRGPRMQTMGMMPTSPIGLKSRATS